MDSQVSCLMDANPASDLTFKWKFNTTSNTVDIPVTFFFVGKFNAKWSVMFNKNVNTVIVVFNGSSLIHYYGGHIEHSGKKLTKSYK